MRRKSLFIEFEVFTDVLNELHHLHCVYVACACLWMHVCYPAVFDVYSIGLCMSLPFSVFPCLSFSTDIWRSVKQLCLLQSPLGFIAYLQTHTKILPHVTSHPLSFHNIPTSRYAPPKLVLYLSACFEVRI